MSAFGAVRRLGSARLFFAGGGVAYVHHRKPALRNESSFDDSSDDNVDKAPTTAAKAQAWLIARSGELASILKVAQWTIIRERIASGLIPPWASLLPGFAAKFRDELDLQAGSLAWEIWTEARDPTVHPEIAWNARVRRSRDLCFEEKAFRRHRKMVTADALAKYLRIPRSSIHPEDVPTIAICGSGGGLRALVSGAASCLTAQTAGLLDCAMYTAGVSGSCWLQTIYLSSLGRQDYHQVINHLKSRIGTHFAFPPSFLDLLTRAPTNKFILAGIIEKIKGDPSAPFGIVDAYGVLLATRLMVPKDEIRLQNDDLKLSMQRRYVAAGQNPMPIYTAVRHEIPIREEMSKQPDNYQISKKIASKKAEDKAFFQWFEFSPYELWSEDAEAGIPTWSVGRHFRAGETRVEDDGLCLPEMKLPFLMGVWGSAFCATLAHYYHEVRPLFMALAGFSNVDRMLEQRKEELTRIHPIEPGAVPNYLQHMHGLPAACTEALVSSAHLELMDSGMANNLPMIPLLRKEREVDLIVCFDASAKVQEENWLRRVDEYAQKRKIKAWPRASGWLTTEDIQETEKPPGTAGEGDSQDTSTHDQGEKGQGNKEKRESEENFKPTDDLTFCNIWIGDKSKPGHGHRIHDPTSVADQAAIKSPNAGIAVSYFPLLPNSDVPGVEPDASPYLSTWNFIYTPEEIDSVVSLAKANFDTGESMTKELVRAIYLRKRDQRLAIERAQAERNGP